MQWRPIYALGSILICVVLGTHAAQADPPGPNVLPVAVINVQSEGADDQADALTSTLRSRIRAMKGFSVMDGDWSLEVLALALSCGDDIDAACEAKIGDRLPADRYLWAKMKRIRATKRVAVDLHLWVRGRPGGRTQLSYSDNLTAPGDDALQQIVDDAIVKLLGETLRGTLQIKAPGVAAADVYIDGQPAGNVRNGAGTVRALPGERRVELRAGNATQAMTVQVRPDATMDVSFGEKGGGPPPAAEPVASSTAIHVAPAAVAPRTASPRRAGLRAAAGWTGIGLGAVLVGAGVYSVVRIHQIDTDAGFEAYRKGFGPQADVCNRADMGVASSAPGAASPSDVSSLCGQASTFETLQYVFFGLGALSTAGGVYLLVSDRKHRLDSSGAWNITSGVGPSGGRVEVRYVF